MSDVLRHISQLDLLPCIRFNGYLNRRHLWPFVSGFGVADYVSDHDADCINHHQQKQGTDECKRREKVFIGAFGAMQKVDRVD
jgi:hypothetical protein